MKSVMGLLFTLSPFIGSLALIVVGSLMMHFGSIRLDATITESLTWSIGMVLIIFGGMGLMGTSFCVLGDWTR